MSWSEYVCPLFAVLDIALILGISFHPFLTLMLTWHDLELHVLFVSHLVDSLLEYYILTFLSLL